MRDIAYCLSCKKTTRNINPRIVSENVLFAIINSLNLFHKDLVCSIV